MKNINQLKMGAILSYANLAIGSIVPFVYTPIMLNILSQNEYGLYTLATSVIGYLSLLNFGLGNAIIQYIGKYKIKNDLKQQQRIIGLFIVLYGILGILVFIVGIVIVFLADEIFLRTLSIEEISNLKILIFIMTINTAITFPGSVFSSISIAYEKFIFRKSIDLLSTILLPVMNLFVLICSFGTIGMTISSSIIQCIIIIINIWYCMKKLKIVPRFDSLPFEIIKEIMGFSIFIFLATLVDMLYWSTDKILIGAMIGTSAVATYNIGGTFNGIIQQLSIGISGVLVPKITGMVFKNASIEELSNIFIKIGRLQYIIVSLVVSGFIVFGKQFIIFMAGNGYEESYIIALLTMIPLVIPLIQNTGLNIIVAKNKHKFRSIMYLTIAIINIVFTIICLKHSGIIGAALCSAIAFFIGNGIIMNIYYKKVIGLDIVTFWKNILDMTVVPFFMVVLGLYLNNIFDMDTIFKFLIGVVLYTVVFILSMFIFKMNSYERGIFLSPIYTIRKGFNKFYKINKNNLIKN